MLNVLITGANRGIGLALVREYLQRGRRVVATCRQPEQASALQALKDKYAEQLIMMQVDVTSYEQIIRCREQVGEKLDALHLLINNAGILRSSEHLADIKSADLMQSFQVNAVAPLLMAQAFANLLSAGAPSKLVNITMPTPPISKLARTDNQIYVSSRYALNALTKMISLELGKQGITTIGFYPGYIQTDMNHYAEQAMPAELAIPTAVDTIEAVTSDQNGMAILSNGQIYDW